MMDIQDLVSAYENRWNEHVRRIEAAFKGGKKVKEVTDACPNYLEEVIIPTYRLLAESLPGYQIKIPDPKTYRPIKDYYRVKVGVTVVGGFSVPESDDFSVFFTKMRHASPSGEKRKINRLNDLTQLVINQPTTSDDVL